MNLVRNEVALFAPPFSASPSPYISLPTLMGWLKKEGITTRFVDLARDLEAAGGSPRAVIGGAAPSAGSVLPSAATSVNRMSILFTAACAR